MRPGFLVAAALLCGCTVSSMIASEGVDPFARTAPAGPKAYQELTAAYYLSPGAKTSVASLKDEFGKLGDITPETATKHLSIVLKDNFKSALHVRSFEDGAAVSADVTAVLDFSYVIPESRREAVRVEAGYEFLDARRRRLDVFSAEGSAPVRGNGYLGAFSIAVEQARAALDRALRSSDGLARFARRASRGETSARTRPDSAAPAKVSSPVDKPAYRLRERPNDYALVIGIEKYSALPEASFAKRDATAVRDHLLALGTPARNMVFITGDRAGKAGIQKYVESWLPENVNAQSRVFVFFAGHGAPDPETGTAYLIPWDGDVKYLKNTAYPLARLYEKLGQLKVKQVFLAMDSCFSGAGGRSLIAKGTRPLVTTVRLAPDMPENLVVLAAAAGDETTGTLERHRHGLFTYYFLKGLSVKAKDPKKIITARSLYNYLAPKVRSSARRENRDQNPRLLLKASGSKDELPLW